MNKCEQYCRTIQRLCNTGGGGGSLPTEYQRVEYLQSDGNQYIVTSVPIAPETETRCTGEFLSNPGNLTSLVGGRNNNNSDGRYIPLGVSSASTLRFVYSSHEPNVSTTAQSLHSVIFNDAEHKAYLDGELKATFTNVLSISSQQNVSLFGMIGYNGSTVGYKTKGRLYSVSFYNNTTGDKLGDYIPCYRKSDNKPGMYDIVTNTFFTNAGTGEFSVGNNV